MVSHVRDVEDLDSQALRNGASSTGRCNTGRGGWHTFFLFFLL